MDAPKRSACGKKKLRLEGITSGNNHIPGKVHYCADLSVKNSDGKVFALNDTLIKVEKATEICLYVSMATNFVNYKDISANPYERNEKYLKNSMKDFEKAKIEHVAAYKKCLIELL